MRARYLTVAGPFATPESKFITGDNRGQMALKTALIVEPSPRFERGAPNFQWGRTMAAPKNLRILPGGRINGLTKRVSRNGGNRLLIHPPAGPLLFLGGCTYAAAYLLLGIAGFTAWSGLLAIVGTGLILLGLRRTWSRA